VRLRGRQFNTGFLLVLLFGSLACPSACPATGGRDLVDGWLLGPAAAAEFVGGPATAQGGVWATVGQSRLFGMSELPVAAVNVGLRLARWPGQPTLAVAWQTLGEGLYREDDRRLHLQLGNLPAVGIALRSVVIRTGGELGISLRTVSQWQAAVTFQAQWRPAPGARLQVQLWLDAGHGGDRQNGGRQGGDARRPLARIQGWQGPMALAAALDLKPDQTPTVSLEWNLGWGGGACGLRADPATGSLGPVLVFRRGRLLVRTSHLSHPVLGVTHRVQLGLGSWGAPRW